MRYEKIIRIINDMASSFLCLDDQRIDVPAAGTFLNHLDKLMEETEAQAVIPLSRVARGLSVLLEQMVLNGVDRAEGSRLFEKGITMMQDIITRCEAGNDCGSDMEPYLESLCSFAGFDPGEDAAGEAGPMPQETAEEDRFEIQDPSLLKDFITEGLEYIGEIETNVLNLEQSPDDKEYINAVFRPFHSIKGVASFLDLADIRELAHNLETLLDRVRSGELPVGSVLIDIILDGADVLKEMIESLQEVLEGTRPQPLKLDTSDLLKRIESIDSVHDDEGEVKKLGAILVEDGVISSDLLDAALEKEADGLPKKLGERLIEDGKAAAKQVSTALRKQARQVTATNTIRVDVKKLDDLIDMIGELVITQAMIRQNHTIRSATDRKLMGDISQLASITSELQRTSTGLRMIPIKQTFQRMARLIRDLAKNAGKQVTISMSGEDTEIDRNMVEEIYNPLVHMIRNSVDHGIETPEERMKSGKPDKGLIELKAYHKGGNIVIEISDDGRGLKKDRLIRKAIDKGLIKSADSMSDHEIFRLIFHPGFSTAEKVTDVSGRGVGMDVVKQAVEKLRGKIDITSVEGKGTTFATHFPLTMAIIDGMIVRIGMEKYIIPATAIRQLLRPKVNSYNNVVGRGEMLNVMGNLLPLVRLHEIFNIESAATDPCEALVVVVEAENRAKCLLVDEVIGKEEVVIKGLGDGLKNIRGVSGGAILGDGNVGLILDPESLFMLSEN
jgi:two-component system chemotaxis sensor kinase CheA